MIARALVVAATATAVLLVPSARIAAAPVHVRCETAHVRGSFSTNGATGKMVLIAELRNFGRTACVLGRRPRMQLLDQSGRRLPVRQYALRDDLKYVPWSGPFVTRLRPSGTAVVWTIWSNWCERRRVHTVHVVTRWGAVLRARADRDDGSGTPRCDFPRRPSWLGVSRFLRG